MMLGKLLEGILHPPCIQDASRGSSKVSQKNGDEHENIPRVKHLDLQ